MIRCCPVPVRGVHVAPLTLVALGLVILAGCAAVQNTAQQDLAWQRWAECRTQMPDADLVRIDPDGRIRLQVTAGHDRERVLTCLATLDARGPRLPEPVVQTGYRGP